MKTTFHILVLLCTLILLSFTALKINETQKEKQAIKDLILESYVHGAFNELDPQAMLDGFHPEFAIFSADGEDIKRYPIATWADNVSKRKSAPDFNAADNKWDHNFASVDVTGGSASVKIELSKDGKHIFTDYLSLLKFDSGWKIVAKVYHRHE